MARESSAQAAGDRKTKGLLHAWRSRFEGRRLLMPLVVLAIGLASTAIVALQYDRIAQERDQQRFQALVAQRVVAIEERMNLYTGLLRSGAAFFAAARGQVTREDFRAFFERMRVDRHYPGVQGLGFVAVVPDGGEAALAARLADEGRPGFTIWPPLDEVEPADGVDPVPRTAIVYLEPEDERNLTAIGFDMASERTRREAMMRARDTSLSAASGVVRLVQEIDTDVQPGILIYAPVYEGSVPATIEERRRRLIGFVYSPFRARDLFEALMRNQPHAELDFAVFGGASLEEDTLLFRTGRVEDGGRLSLRAEERITVAQRPWTVLLETTPAFEAASPRVFTPFIAIVGLAVTTLLTAASLGQARAIADAERSRDEVETLAQTLEHRVERRTVQLERARARLSALNMNLERAVEARTAELSAANEEIQRFAYIVSHDLRAPLVNVMGFTSELDSVRGDIESFLERVSREAPQLVETGARDAIETDLPEALGFIRASTQKMDRLINAILKLSREGRRVLAPEPVDLAGLVSAMSESLAHQLDEKNAAIASEDLPTIVSDRLALEQVFGNLIENAVKYLSPDRPGRIRVTAEDVGPLVRVSIADNGRGIDPKDFERIFDLFRRAGRQDTPGEGIGLAHVRALVRRLGGSIEVASTPGEGSTFTVTLPRTFTSETSAEPNVAGETEEAA